VIINYNKAGLLKNHFFLRDMKANVLANNPSATPADYISLIVPGDVSEDFKKHMESWERAARNTKLATSGEPEEFRKLGKADHLLMCLAYADMILDQCELLGDQLARLGLKPETKEELTNS